MYSLTNHTPIAVIFHIGHFAEETPVATEVARAASLDDDIEAGRGFVTGGDEMDGNVIAPILGNAPIEPVAIVTEMIR